MPIKSLEDALKHELRDMLSAERQIAKALPKMAKAASDERLKSAFEEHLAQTQEHIQLVEQVFEVLGQKPRSSRCEAMEGIVREGEELLEEGEEPVKDALLIAAAQKVEHYEIASYGTLCTWCKTLGQNDALGLLKQILDQEKQTDEKLTKLATQLNKEAK